MKRLFFITTVVLSCFTSCSMMHDDLDGCPNGLYLQFEYNYNIQRADMFKDQVGNVTVYVFDDKGAFVEKKTVANTDENDPLKTYGYKMNISNLKPGKYQFIALANQESYFLTRDDAGAKYHTSDLQVGDSMSKMKIKVDNVAKTINLYGTRYDNVDSVSMETLWHGISKTELVVDGNTPAYQTLSLVRDTKDLAVSLRQLNEKDSCSIDDYDVFIVDRNTTLNYDNSVVDTTRITYTPFAKWNTYFMSDGTSTQLITSDTAKVLEETAHADLNFNRLIYRNANDDPAMLYIYNKKHDVMIAKINLADCLSQGRNAWEYFNYTPQEYLDRESTYKLEFILDGDRWDYINLSVSILPWTKRIQNVSL